MMKPRIVEMVHNSVSLITQLSRIYDWDKISFFLPFFTSLFSSFLFLLLYLIYCCCLFSPLNCLNSISVIDYSTTGHFLFKFWWKISTNNLMWDSVYFILLYSFISSNFRLTGNFFIFHFSCASFLSLPLFFFCLLEYNCLTRLC